MNMVLQYIYLIRKCFVSVQDKFSFLEYIICSVKSNIIINILKNVVYYFKYNFKKINYLILQQQISRP